MRKKYVTSKMQDKKRFLLLAILGMAIGFAALATTLKINGFTLVRKNTWDIRWNRNSITMSEDMPANAVRPTVSTSVSGSTDDTVSFTANLTLPGDFYEFYIDAINKGTVNGKVASVTTIWKKNDSVITELPDFLDYKIVYADNQSKPQAGDDLLAGASRTYQVRLEYKIDATTMPDTNDQYSAEVSIVYNQAGRGDTLTRGPGSENLYENADPEPDMSGSLEDPIIVQPPKTEDTPKSVATPNTVDALYAGANPNNYIYFNCDSLDKQNDSHCELWRIVRTDSSVGNRIKIIKNIPLTENKLTARQEDEVYDEYGYFDYKYFAWNTGGTDLVTNDWGNSTLKEYLNGEYYNSLTEVSKKLIPTVKWYNAGGYNVVRLNAKRYSTDDSIHDMTAASAYVNERTVFKTDSEDLKRSNVFAKVGLMYASDYGYASSRCVSDCTSTGGHPCYTGSIWCDEPSESDFYDMFDESGYGSELCQGSNWIYLSNRMYVNGNEWTLTTSMANQHNQSKGFTGAYYYDHGDFEQRLNSEYCKDPNKERKYFTYNAPGYNNEEYKGVLTISYDGNIATYDADYEFYVRPAVYLKSGVGLEGTGSREDPYRIIADSKVLDNDDVLPSDSDPDIEDPDPTEPPELDPEEATVHTEDNSCGDSTPPTCELNYVNRLSNGFAFAFNCTDDVKINRITSLFDHDPYHGQYDSSSFKRIGTIKNGTVVNGGKTKTYSGRWTTLSSNPPNRNTCYYFSYGGEDKCGNWVVYHTPNCYRINN